MTKQHSLLTGAPKPRSLNIDIAKCAAVFGVVFVHFFLNNSFYGRELNSPDGMIGIVLRQTFMYCVPLFLLITGYLMGKKFPSRQYYSRIFAVLAPFIMAAAAIGVFAVLRLGCSPKDVLRDTISFSLGYSWYVEMYLGLFILIPFLNVLYSSLRSRRHKQLLIISLIILASLPATLNGIWRIVPDYFTGLWPFTYYFIGSYLKEFKIKLRIRQRLLVMASLIIFATALVYAAMWRQGAPVFSEVFSSDWGYIGLVFYSSLLFSVLLELDFSRLKNPFFVRLVTSVAKLTLPTYLLSFIFDYIMYSLAKSLLGVPVLPLWTILVLPLAVFILSFISALILSPVSDYLSRFLSHLFDKVFSCPPLPKTQ